MNVFVVVGTTPFGWDDLVQRMDEVAGQMGLHGTVQIGNGATTPVHLESQRFLSHPDVLAAMMRADLTVCHGGLGSIGDGLRRAQRLVVVPRELGKGRRGRQAAPNDQWPVATRLAERYDFVCADLVGLRDVVTQTLELPVRQPREFHTDAGRIIKDWAARTGVGFE